MSDTPLFDESPLPDVPEGLSTPDCDCGAKLADLTRAVELLSEHSQEQTEKISALITAVNSVGTMVQSIMDNASGFLGQFKNMNPMDIIKGALSGKR